MQLSDLVYIDSAGYHFADYPTFLAWRTQQYQGIYGADVYIDPDSQDGQLLAAQAQADYDTAALGAAVYNSFSPVTAQGLGLSRLVKINGLSRGVPTNSSVDLTIVGQAGTVITNGVAVDTLQQKWNLPTTVSIPGGGSIVVTALAQLQGAITAEAGTVSGIFTPTLGWQTVTNVAAATPGAPVETDAALRLRQQASTANPSTTVIGGTVGALSNLLGVTKVQAYENDSDTTDGNGIPEHSVSFVVNGGDAVEIAQTIALHKTPGTNTYGTTSEAVTDAGGMPITIDFFRPTIASIKVSITLAKNDLWSNDYIALIKQAVADQINAGEIGAPVLITKLYGPAYLTGTPAYDSYDIVSLTIKKNAGAFGTSNITLAFNEIPVCVASTDVTVIVT